MAGSANFALRMTPELKRAAKVLTEVAFREPSMQEGKFNHIILGSINEAILYLMRSGIRATLVHIDKEIDEYKKEHELWQEILTFFINNLTADFASPVSFPEDSRARSFISSLREDDPESWGQGVDRATAADEFAGNQRQLLKLIEAKGLLQRAS